jgi:hypothetical protein
MVAAGLPLWLAMATNLLVFAGTSSSPPSSLRLPAHAPGHALGGRGDHLRFTLYSRSLAPHVRHAPLRLRLLLS